ncbi:MAG: hypothetical protein R3C30_02770 [Hyphomonadaceae bacterium]
MMFFAVMKRCWLREENQWVSPGGSVVTKFETKFVGANDPGGNAHLTRFLQSKKAMSPAAEEMLARILLSDDRFALLALRLDALGRRTPVAAALAEPVVEAPETKLLHEAVIAERKHRDAASLRVHDEFLIVSDHEGGVAQAVVTVPLDIAKRPHLKNLEGPKEQVLRLEANGYKLVKGGLPASIQHGLKEMLRDQHVAIMMMDDVAFGRALRAAKVRRFHQQELSGKPRAEIRAGHELFQSLVEALGAVEIEPKVGPLSVRIRAELATKEKSPPRA